MQTSSHCGHGLEIISIRASMKVAWISSFPVEWIPGAPDWVQRLPRLHPSSWQRVLFDELVQDPGLELHLFVLRKHFPRHATFSIGPARFHLVKTIPFLRAPTLFWSDTFQLAPRLRALQPDLVHAWGVEHGAGLVAGRLPHPSVLSMQGIFSWLQREMPVNPYQHAMAWLEPWNVRKVSQVTVESRFGLEYMRRTYPGLPVQQLEHAPAREFFDVRREPALSPRRLLFVGSLNHAKGADLLHASLKSLIRRDPIHLCCIGGGDPAWIDSFRSLFHSSPERLEIRGPATREEIAAELGKATLLVFPSRAENSPNVVKEAIVAGVPVVASAVGSVPDYIVPAGNGMLFAAGDGAAMARALDQALTDPLLGTGRVDPSLLAARRKELAPEKMAAQFRDLYRRVAKEKPFRDA